MHVSNLRSAGWHVNVIASLCLAYVRPSQVLEEQAKSTQQHSQHVCFVAFSNHIMVRISAHAVLDSTRLEING
jgi:hypothetical protein